MDTRLFPPSRRQTLMWIGMFAGPVAWAAQHLAGLSLSVADCHDMSLPRSDIHYHAWVIVVTAGALALTIAGQLSAIAAWRLTRGEEELPGARIHFLAVVGMAITPLFTIIVLMSGIGALILPQCVQS
jgi:hypothetical protein